MFKLQRSKQYAIDDDKASFSWTRFVKDLGERSAERDFGEEKNSVSKHDRNHVCGKIFSWQQIWYSNFF